MSSRADAITGAGPRRTKVYPLNQLPALPYPTRDDSPGISTSDRGPQSDPCARRGKGRNGGL